LFSAGTALLQAYWIKSRRPLPENFFSEAEKKQPEERLVAARI